MSHIIKIGKGAYWCNECQLYLLSDEAIQNHTHKLSQKLTGVEKHWLEQEQDNMDYDTELTKRIGIRWP